MGKRGFHHVFFNANQQQQKNFFSRGDFRPHPNKNVQFWDHFFPALFPQGFWIFQNFGRPTSGSGGKIGLKMYHMKRDIKQTHKHIDTHTDTRTSQLLDQIGPVKWKSMNFNTQYIKAYTFTPR